MKGIKQRKCTDPKCHLWFLDSAHDQIVRWQVSICGVQHGRRCEWPSSGQLFSQIRPMHFIAFLQVLLPWAADPTAPGCWSWRISQGKTCYFLGLEGHSSGKNPRWTLALFTLQATWLIQKDLGRKLMATWTALVAIWHMGWNYLGMRSAEVVVNPGFTIKRPITTSLSCYTRSFCLCFFQMEMCGVRPIRQFLMNLEHGLELLFRFYFGLTKWCLLMFECIVTLARMCLQSDWPRGRDL